MLAHGGPTLNKHWFNVLCLLGLVQSSRVFYPMPRREIIVHNLLEFSFFISGTKDVLERPWWYDYIRYYLSI